MRTIAAEIKHAGGQDVVANARNGVSFRVAHPFASPFSIDLYCLDSRMFETRTERWALQIAIECPTVRQSVHLLTPRAPVHIGARGSPKSGAYLVHFVTLGSSARRPTDGAGCSCSRLFRYRRTGPFPVAAPPCPRAFPVARRAPSCWAGCRCWPASC